MASNLKPSARGVVEPFRVMQIVGKAQAHPDALLMCVGQPLSGPPKAVIDAAHAALENAPLGYTPTLGLGELREAIASWHRRTYQVDTKADNVVVTTGSSGGFVAAFLALLEPGDRVALNRPGYPAYRNTLQAVGAEVVDLECGPETRYQPTVEVLEQTHARLRRESTDGKGLKMVVVTSPDNPTGTIIDSGELARIAAWCERNQVVLVSDEIYHGISYGRETATARKYSQQAAVVGSMSKYFCMTGWRLGWLIVPDYLVEVLENLEANIALCPPAISQHAALAAFSEQAAAELDAHVAQYARTRDFLLQALPELGLGTFAPPDGGFYLWVDISHLTQDSERWAADLLERTGVAVAPGVDFDPIGGKQTIRISFCVDEHTAAEAVRRIRGYLGS